MEWFERLQARVRELGWSKRELHRRSDVPYDSVVKYLKGDVDNPRGDILDKLATAVGVTEVWLRYGVDREPAAMASPRIPPHRVPILTLRELSAMGLAGATAAALADGRTSPAIGGSGPRAFVIKIEDDANAPALAVGDSIFCDPDQNPSPGAVVVIRTGGQVLIRRYRLKSLAGDGLSQAEFFPENQNHPTIASSSDRPVEILAVATHRVHSL